MSYRVEYVYYRVEYVTEEGVPTYQLFPTREDAEYGCADIGEAGGRQMRIVAPALPRRKAARCFGCGRREVPGLDSCRNRGHHPAKRGAR